MKLRFTPRAVRDLAEIADTIRTHDPSAALRVRAAILDTIDLVAGFPALGRAQDVPGVRKIVVRRFPYFVYYAVDEAAAEIAVLTIRHAARDEMSA